MKLSIFLLVFLSFSLAFSQDSSSIFSVERKYGGIFNSAFYDESGIIHQSATVRLGTQMKLNLTPSTKIGVRGVWATDANIFHFWGEQKIGPVNLLAGFMPHPLAVYLKPNPVSSGGHFEPSPKRVIPGSSTGMAVSFKTGEMEFIGGVYRNTEKNPEYNFAAAFLKKNVVEIKMGGFYTSYNAGIGLSAKIGSVDLTSYSDTDSTFSLYIGANLIVDPYFTLVRNYNSHSIKNLEIGFTKEASLPLYGLKILMGIGGQIKPIKAVNFYLLVSL